MNHPVIDTHQHLWDPGVFRYSWMDGFPALGQKAMLEEYQQAAVDLNIVQTVYVDTDVDECDREREIRAILALSDNPLSGIAGVVAGAKLEKEDPFVHFGSLAGHPKLKGVRRVLHTQPDDLSRQLQFVENVRSLSSRQWSFDLCVLARQLLLARELVEKCPDVSFILDHCGCPDVKAGTLDPWRDDLRELSLLPNVACKVSGLVAYADPKSWSAEDLKPFFKHVVACFGWDRLMWGGDWPVCKLTASLKEWLEAAVVLTADATEEQRLGFFAGNARRIYRLG